MDPCLPSSIVGTTLADTPTALRLCAQQRIFLNSLLNIGFIPAYINGFTVLEKYIQKLQRSSTLRDIVATRRKRHKITITQNGIQHIMNASTTVVCYTAFFRVVTQRSSLLTAAENRTTFLSRDKPIIIQLPFLWGGALRDDTKNGCVAD